MLFRKPNKAIGIDLGSYSVKAAQMSKEGGRYRLDAVGMARIDPNQMNNDPAAAQADAVREAVRSLSDGQAVYVGALPGQTVVIRYPRMPDMSDAELQRSIEQEASQNLPYELSEVFVDWTVLDRSTENEEAQAKILLVAAKHELIDSRYEIAELADIHYNILGVDSLALADAAEACDFLRVGETVALIDIGAASTIIHFVKDGVSNFYRDVNWGSRELVGALTKSRRMDTAAAEQMLFELAEEKPGEFEPEQVEALEADDDEEPGGLIEGLGDEDSEGGELEALGGSSLDPLEDEVAEPTTRTSIGGGHGAQEEQSVEEILHMPLSRFAGELRRSFDYYEQQLYERPVDRVILSGGVAQVPYVRSAIRDELGLEHVEAANPCESALVLGPEAGISPMRKHPAVFMVAVGLAARGVSEL